MKTGEKKNVKRKSIKSAGKSRSRGRRDDTIESSVIPLLIEENTLAISSFLSFLRCNLSWWILVNMLGKHSWQACLPRNNTHFPRRKDSSFPMWRALYFRWIVMLNMQFHLLNFGFIFVRMCVEKFYHREKELYVRSITFYRIERVRWHLHDNTAYT